MPSRRTAAIITAAIVVFGLVGCSRDPKMLAQKYVESGRRYYEKDKYREAIIEFSNASRVDPTSAEAHYRLGMVYLRIASWRSAAAEFNRAVALNDSHLPARVSLGTLLLAGGNIKGAQQQADFILAKDPSNVEAMALMANIEQAEGNGPEALVTMGKALQHSDDPELFFNMAILQSRNDNLPQTEVYLKKSVELEKKSAKPRLALAGFYVSQQRWDKAEEQFKTAIQLDSKQLGARLALARFYMMRQQNDRALEVLRDAKNDLPENSMALRAVANFYFATGDVDKAISEYASLVQQHPKDDGLKKAEIIALMAANRMKEAGRVAETLEKSSTRDTEAMLLRSELQLREGKPADAMRTAQEAVNKDLNNPFAHHQLGTALLAAGDSGRAEGEFRAALKLQPNLLPSLRALAPIALAKQDAATLADCADRLIKLQPLAYDGYLLRAAAEDGRKEDDKSFADLEKAASLAPNNPAPQNKLGTWYGEHKRLAEARKSFERALALDSENTEAMFNLIKVFNAQNDVRGAIARLRTQVNAAPSNATFQTMLGQLLAGSNDLQAAEAPLHRALELQPKNAVAYAVLSGVQASKGNTDAAIATTDLWITELPDDVMSYMTKGSLVSRKGDSNQALQLFKKALQIQPDFPLAAHNAAYLMLQQGKDLDVALSLAQVARRGMPASPNAADTLGWAYYQKGTYRSAIELLEEATRKVPSNPAFHYHLGMAYSKMNDHLKARAELQRALQLNPKLAEAQRAQ